MILIGQYDSPFVRRVGIALTLYELPFEHWPWSTFGDADRLIAYNPLLRVPVLVTDDGDTLLDSHSIIDHVDGLASPEARLLPVNELERRRAMKSVSLATGISDKAVSLFYENVLHDHPSTQWIERCKRQIAAALSALELEGSRRTTAFWNGEHIGHADIATGAMLDHLIAAHPDLIDLDDYPVLQRHGETLRAMPVFQSIYQPFIPPA
jgi:glutathione S-transferase